MFVKLHFFDCGDYCDIIDVPECVIESYFNNHLDFRNRLYDWLKKQNSSKYYIKKTNCYRYGNDTLIEWLNAYFLKNHDKKAEYIEKSVLLHDINYETIPVMSF